MILFSSFRRHAPDTQPGPDHEHAKSPEVGSRRATELQGGGHGLKGSLVKDFDTKDDPWEPVMSSKRASKVPSLHYFEGASESSSKPK